MIKESNAPVYRKEFSEAPALCESCSFVSTCDQPPTCVSLRYHTETGRACRPPRRPPANDIGIEWQQQVKEPETDRRKFATLTAEMQQALRAFESEMGGSK